MSGRVFTGSLQSFAGHTWEYAASFKATIRRNGVNVPGATTRDFTIASVNASHAGTYDVVVTTPGDSETSN
ncbi:MAG: hypothetical protein K1X50_01085, partial [Candidatus Promineofilum sp.]|nr:hypothetical protein [Promineifilum sp.]